MKKLNVLHCTVSKPRNLIYFGDVVYLEVESTCHPFGRVFLFVCVSRARVRVCVFMCVCGHTGLCACLCICCFV